MAVDPEYALDHDRGTPQQEQLKRISLWANSPTPSNHSASLRQLAKDIDIDNAIDYYSSVVFLKDCDSIRSNFFLYQTENDHRFKFSVWDWDNSLNRSC
jgi:spore coat protein CotH